jgi:hypothetical protein
MKAVDEGGIVGHQIKISYDPANVSDASGPENDSATALGMWSFAILYIAFGGWLLRRGVAGPKGTKPQVQGWSTIESFAAASEGNGPQTHNDTEPLDRHTRP